MEEARTTGIMYPGRSCSAREAKRLFLVKKEEVEKEKEEQKPEGIEKR